MDADPRPKNADLWPCPFCGDRLQTAEWSYGPPLTFRHPATGCVLDDSWLESHGWNRRAYPDCNECTCSAKNCPHLALSRDALVSIVDALVSIVNAASCSAEAVDRIITLLEEE